MFVPTPSTPPSARVQELATRLADIVRQFRQSYTDLSSSEVDQALNLARAQLGSGLEAQKQRMLIAVLLGVLVMGLGFALLFFRANSTGRDLSPMLPIFIGAIIIGVLAVVAATRR